MQSASREGSTPSLEAITENVILRCIRCIPEIEDSIYLIVKDARDEDVLLKSRWNYYQ